MDPVSAVAIVIAIYQLIYQLASTASVLCFHYSQGVRGADQDADLVINEIDMFQRYLRSMRQTLSNGIEATDGVDRLRSLNEVISGESAALNLCIHDLEDLQTKLLKAQSGGHLKETNDKLSWPLKKAGLDNKLNTLKQFVEAVDRALNLDDNEIIGGVDSRSQQMQISLERRKLQQKRQDDFFQQSQDQLGAGETK